MLVPRRMVLIVNLLIYVNHCKSISIHVNQVWCLATPDLSMLKLLRWVRLQHRDRSQMLGDVAGAGICDNPWDNSMVLSLKIFETL